MRRTRIVHARSAITWIWALLLITNAGRVHSQSSRAGDVLAWVDGYYADYSAMSTAPTGPAMDRWLTRYAPYAFFEDPTAGQGAIGRDTIRKTYVDAFTGALGPVRWHVLRRVASGEWVAVEGWLEGTQTGQPFRTRFTTWLKILKHQIVHQVDYVDYASMRRQVAGTEQVPQVSPDSTSVHGKPDPIFAMRVAGEFYDRYEAMPVMASSDGVARFTDLLTDDFRLEDPTAGMAVGGRERYRATLNGLLAAGGYGVFHWDIDRRLTHGEWIAVEGAFRGIFKGKPFATRFSTWLRIRGDRIAHQIDYVDYKTFRRQTATP
jgi:ketosteroid isomerase-like protein